MKETNTVWKPVVGYEGLYEVSIYGEIKSIKTGKLLKPRLSTGYAMVALWNNGLRKDLKIHRLVAIAYIKNPMNKPQVNHIDGNKLNNELSNLEWVTNSENLKHAYKNGLITISNRKRQIIAAAVSKAHSKKVMDIKTGIIYKSLTQGCISINMNCSTANKQINRNSKNQRFKYI
jgi:hypothetical protein